VNRVTTTEHGTDTISLDVAEVRRHFPAFDQAEQRDQSFFENAGGSFACRQTIEALTHYYVENKVQPYADYPSSARAGALMDRSRERWAEALGVEGREVVFGPSTSANTYVLAHAFGELLEPGDEVVVTDQDHEANTGAIRRAAERAGATLREWQLDRASGQLDLDRLRELVGSRTRVVTMPHASNIIGQENDVAAAAHIAHRAGARIVVDGVSFAPHTIPDVAALGADVYLFSLYKTYSVHQGLMVVRSGTMTELPNQGHFFNADVPDKRLNPAGPDHAQVAAAGAVLDYVDALHRHHGGPPDATLRQRADFVSALWRSHEDDLLPGLLGVLADRQDVRVLGADAVGELPGHRCPTVAFDPLAADPADVARELVRRGVQTSSGHYYAVRVLQALGVDPDRGVVRLSFVHYTTPGDIERAASALAEVLGPR